MPHHPPQHAGPLPQERKEEEPRLGLGGDLEGVSPRDAEQAREVVLGRLGGEASAPADPEAAERVAREVRSRLAGDAWLDASAIGVSVSGGEVRLEGRVADRIQRRRAEDLAGSVPGVAQVRNALRLPDDEAPRDPAAGC
jgi:hypothetical protein